MTKKFTHTQLQRMDVCICICVRMCVNSVLLKIRGELVHLYVVKCYYLVKGEIDSINAYDNITLHIREIPENKLIKEK